MSKQIEEVMGLVNAYAAMQGVEPYDKQVEAHDAIEAKLREILPVWQPIEIAPKDTEILVTGAKRIGTCVAHNDSRDGWETETSSEWVSIYTPTHWMPLPKAPE